ncbi:MAG: hypothetical protein H0U49_01880 [Parachlamydiaceae bacterium]|nr:hypothetical protein [Parachlamydiaceae bacterium]
MILLGGDGYMSNFTRVFTMGLIVSSFSLLPLSYGSSEGLKAPSDTFLADKGEKGGRGGGLRHNLLGHNRNYSSHHGKYHRGHDRHRHYNNWDRYDRRSYWNNWNSPYNYGYYGSYGSYGYPYYSGYSNFYGGNSPYYDSSYYYGSYPYNYSNSRVPNINVVIPLDDDGDVGLYYNSY